MSNLKCLIIDDEPVARKIIREYIADVDFLELAGEAENVMDTHLYAGNKDINLIFLDIQMPGMNGIEYLRTNHPAALTIMTTAYPDYALQGYELDVLDYLVKPIAFERFMKAVQKAQDFCLLKAKAGSPTMAEDTILIKCDRKIERLFIQDIIYVEGLANYVIVHTPQRKFITYLTFNGMSEKLPATLFVRIHKSYLISLAAIASVEGNKAILGKIVLPISRYYKSDAMKKINRLVFRRGG